MKLNMNRRLVAGAVVLGLALPAVAATLPQEKTEHGIVYRSGGIGHDEAVAMQAEAKYYPLSMLFTAGKDNEYLADVDVSIKDKAGKAVLHAVSDGPIMLVKVPAGKYAVTAEENGKTLRRTVTVGAKGDTRAGFHWPHA